MLAKSCVKTGDMEKAEQYLWKLQKVKVKTQDDFMAKKEGKQLREKLFKAGNNYSTTGESAEQEKTWPTLDKYTYNALQYCDYDPSTF